MTVSSPPPFINRPEKRKYVPDNPYETQFNPSPSPFHTEISHRVIKKIRPKPITAQSLRGTPPFNCVDASQNRIAIIPRSKGL